MEKTEQNMEKFTVAGLPEMASAIMLPTKAMMRRDQRN